jgi:cell division protein FtsQ
VTEPSGIPGEDPPSPEDAAGDSPTSAAKAGKGPGRRRGSRKWRAAFFALLAAGLLAVAGWAVFLSPLLVVRSVVVTGTHLVPQAEVLAAAGVEPGTPLIRVNTAQAAARVGAIEQISGAQVSRSWPDRVVIAVRERVPALLLTAPGGGYDLLDSDGVVVRWSASRVQGLPLYLTSVPVTALRGDQDLAATAAVLRELPASLRRSVSSVTAPAPDQVTLELAGGRAGPGHPMTVLWGGTDRAAAKARELAVLMRSRLSYYDVSAPGSVLAR